LKIDLEKSYLELFKKELSIRKIEHQNSRASKNMVLIF